MSISLKPAKTYQLSAQPRFLVSRTDNLGDVILTLPLCGVIKQIWPEAFVGFVGKAYTRPIIEACQYIDAFIDREQVLQDKSLFAGYEVTMMVFPDRAISAMVKAAGVKYRIGTSHRWWHWLHCNIRPSFTRKDSELHEAQLNIELLKPLLVDYRVPALTDLGQLFGLQADVQLWSGIEAKATNLSASPYIVLHPKSAGSAREWPMSSYQLLARQLISKGFLVVVTGTAKEGDKIRTESPKLFNQPEVIDLTGQLSLAELMTLLGRAYCVVACSTGPLHIASALGVPVVGIYPPIRPMHPGRWAPIGSNAQVLVLEKSCDDCRKTQDCACIKAVEVAQVMSALRLD